MIFKKRPAIVSNIVCEGMVSKVLSVLVSVVTNGSNECPIIFPKTGIV